MKIRSVHFLSTLMLLFSCEPSFNQGREGYPGYAPPESFGDYWYQGVAEITTYDLKQVRYGEVRDGKAVLIYVTEDFSRDAQVKLDNPNGAGQDAVKVLKLNFTKKFTTGIYPYSMMRSTFTPVYLDRDPFTLKTTTSSQEWCGHAFTQLNLQGDQYRVRKFSYFESEGDPDFFVENAVLEDEIWNLIRLAPDRLPEGRFQVIPGTLYDRFSHAGIDVVTAMGRVEQQDDLNVYVLEYERSGRTLRIAFRSDFPHEIEWWEETHPEGSVRDSDRITKATRSGRMLLDYWTKNGTEHTFYRDSLGLE